MAQELLTTFSDDLYGVLLIPSAIAGRYTVRIDKQLVFDREEQGRFPEITELKRIVRDHVAPEKRLGHTEKKEDLGFPE
jgi:selenoprotein W-related protein